MLKYKLMGFIIFALLSITSIYIATFYGSDKLNRFFIENLPQVAREKYLNFVLADRDDHCVGCYFRVDNALQKIRNNLESNEPKYFFKKDLLLPYLSDDIPYDMDSQSHHTACYVLTVLNDKKLFKEFSELYKTDTEAEKECLVGAMNILYNRKYIGYKSIYHNIKSVNGLRKVVESLSEY